MFDLKVYDLKFSLCLNPSIINLFNGYRDQAGKGVISM
jgi:hypothetical protein